MADKEWGKQRCYHLLTLPAAVEVQRLPVAVLSRNPLILKESFPALYAKGHLIFCSSLQAQCDKAGQ